MVTESTSTYCHTLVATKVRMKVLNTSAGFWGFMRPRRRGEKTKLPHRRIVFPLKFRKCPSSWGSAVGFSPSHFCCELMFTVNLSTFLETFFRLWNQDRRSRSLLPWSRWSPFKVGIVVHILCVFPKYMISLRNSRVTVIVSIIFVMIAILLLSSPRGDTRRTDIEAEMEVFHSIPSCKDVSARVSTEILVVTGI